MNKQDQQRQINAAYIAATCTARASMSEEWARRLELSADPEMSKLAAELRTNAKLFQIIADHQRAAMNVETQL